MVEMRTWNLKSEVEGENSIIKNWVPLQSLTPITLSLSLSQILLSPSLPPSRTGRDNPTGWVRAQLGTASAARRQATGRRTRAAEDRRRAW